MDLNKPLALDKIKKRNSKITTTLLPGDDIAEDVDYEINQFIANEITGLFNTMDVDGDNRIGMHEIQSFFASEGTHLLYDDAVAIMTEMGHDEEGLVSFNSFFDFLYEEFKESLTEELLLEVFNMLDLDKDGFLSPIDVQKVYRRFGMNLTLEETHANMQKCDIDDNGLINFEEFKVYFKKTNPFILLLEEKSAKLQREIEKKKQLELEALKKESEENENKNF